MVALLFLLSAKHENLTDSRITIRLIRPRSVQISVLMLYTYLQKYKEGGQMKMMLAENIRPFRNERSLTQE